MKKTTFAIVCVLLIVLPTLVHCSCPTIVSRSEWGARRAKGTTSLKINPAPYAIIHHADTPPCTSESQCKSRVKNVQDYHQNTRKWDDIGYNFLIGGDGKVYEGRGWGLSGAHAPNYNSKSIGICFIGKFDSVSPSEAQLQAARDLLSCGVDSGKLSPSYKLLGHKQVRQTSCPGNSLYAIIKQWPNWAPNP
ncbi:peptidoglycan-recognition protein 2 [Aethina tumida]|uniref:peptidoglycan-recognition protein 2 n=1 Tax=Aethina tumida TaxID=116153 RepID=UPI00096AEEFC|nr:peptidoglycan-recognition protein 2 [Aethina tumida]